MLITSQPSLANNLQHSVPTNPAPPVTSTFITSPTTCEHAGTLLCWLNFPRYRTPGETRSPEPTQRNTRQTTRLGRGDQIRVQNHPDFAAQKVEQDRDPLALHHTFEQSEAR